MSKYMVITNNPLVRSRLDDTHEVIYLELSYEELLKVVRDRIYEGHRLLTHPLSGSVNAILVCQKFQDKSKYYKEEVYKDFQLVDWTLLESGLASADVW